MVHCFASRLFFFKQKSAYEMRIRYWSSDVCSSDLGRLRDRKGSASGSAIPSASTYSHRPWTPQSAGTAATAPSRDRPASLWSHRAWRGRPPSTRSPSPSAEPAPPAHRSEEHTSELQSLMRISYAVFCLKNKITQNHKEEKKSAK